MFFICNSQWDIMTQEWSKWDQVSTEFSLQKLCFICINLHVLDSWNNYDPILDLLSKRRYFLNFYYIMWLDAVNYIHWLEQKWSFKKKLSYWSVLVSLVVPHGHAKTESVHLILTFLRNNVFIFGSIDLILIWSDLDTSCMFSYPIPPYLCKTNISDAKYLAFDHFFFCYSLWYPRDTPSILCPEKDLRTVIVWSKSEFLIPSGFGVMLICLFLWVFMIERTGRNLEREKGRNLHFKKLDMPEFDKN